MMDLITGMVSKNAGIPREQAIDAIEAVLAYISHEVPEELSERVVEKILNSNASSTGGFTDDDILKFFTARYGSVREKLKLSSV